MIYRKKLIEVALPPAGLQPRMDANERESEASPCPPRLSPTLASIRVHSRPFAVKLSMIHRKKPIEVTLPLEANASAARSQPPSGAIPRP